MFALKERFSTLEMKLLKFKDEMREKQRKSEINNLQRILEECDRWLEYGPHNLIELKVRACSYFLAFTSFCFFTLIFNYSFRTNWLHYVNWRKLFAS